jgi:shikimate kinase
MDNIILIGMPGAGKSTIGVLIAKVLGMSFIDCDLIIQKKEGKLLQEIIDEKGIDGFINIEKNTILELSAVGSIISTGGSVVLREESMNKLMKLGKIVYLKVDYNELERRVNNITTRGIVIKDEQTLYDVYEERTPLYEKYTNITIDCSNLTIEQILDKARKEVEHIK